MPSSVLTFILRTSPRTSVSESTPFSATARASMGWQAAVSSSCPIMPKKIRPLLRARSATAPPNASKTKRTPAPSVFRTKDIALLPSLASALPSAIDVVVDDAAAAVPADVAALGDVNGRRRVGLGRDRPERDAANDAGRERTAASLGCGGRADQGAAEGGGGENGTDGLLQDRHDGSP